MSLVGDLRNVGVDAVRTRHDTHCDARESHQLRGHHRDIAAAQQENHDEPKHCRHEDRLNQESGQVVQDCVIPCQVRAHPAALIIVPDKEVLAV